MSRTAFLLLLTLCTAGAASADELRWSDPLPIADVPAGDRLLLEDGRTVRLAGIRLPADEASSRRARATVRALVAHRPVRLGIGEIETDRYGRTVAQVERADGLWLQGALLEQGLALVQTRPGETAQADRMLEQERQARARGQGVWADSAAGPHEAAAAHRHVGSFQIIRGTVVRVAPTERYVYLNFGQDWRSDFTVRLHRAELDASYERFGPDVGALAGRRIEVRGLVLEAGGPLIDISHPEQIEILP